MNVPTVLIADDDPSTRKAMGAFLEDSGFAVMQAENGEQAKALLKEGLPDVLVLDMKMPVMDGWQLLQEIASHPEWRRARVILMTATGSSTADLQNLPNVDRVLGKPFPAAALLEAVGKAW